MLHDAGWKILAVSDSCGAVVDTRGLDPAKLNEIKRKQGSVTRYADDAHQDLARRALHLVRLVVLRDGLPAEARDRVRDLVGFLDRVVADAVEILLEVPLEPFDYPENDPGPDTLLTGQAPRDNIDRLYTVMGRIGGYVGLINNMGARFTASAADFGPMMEELGARGLGYLDDGSSNRSLAAQLAKANRVPFSRADHVLDSNPARAPILAALEALEAKAREQGSAIGIISALPVSVQTVAEWARGLEDRGILVVPASVLMQ